MSSDIEESAVAMAADNLDFIEGWLTKNNVAGSALGRHVLGDQAALSRWRKDGNLGCSQDKRRQLAAFCLKNPDGIPGYSGKRKPGKKPRPSHRFTPNKSPASSRIGQLVPKRAETSTPVPALSHLERESDIDFVKRRAFERGVPIAVVLAEMVSLGISCQQEIDYENEQAQAQEQERNNNNASHI